MRAETGKQARKVQTAEPRDRGNRLVTWAAIDHDQRIFALGEFRREHDANTWFGRFQRGRTVVPLDLLPGQAPMVGDLVALDEHWTGHLVPSIAVGGLHAVIDAAARQTDPWRRHELLLQARAELDAIVQAHADAVTVAALEVA